MFLAFAACLVKGANGPADPALARSQPRSRVEGFGESGFTVQPGQGLPSTTEFCALVADDRPAHEKGMMFRHDFAGYDSMLFRFAEDQDGPFYNRNVPIALSIAWFDANGIYVSATDMAPCGDREDCPLFRAQGRYRLALEVPQGGLGRLGVGPGSVLYPTGPCASR